ncbi:MAG: FAD/NAD(P)-binding protein [Candidatus Omnitrophica bacterium]|nr:FAD/NAD(P)-binding protein [Candidatus Omnitrophota bacterium]
MCKNPYRLIKAQVLDVITETPSIKTIRFKPEEPMSFSTGQFFEITVPGVGGAPFTPSSRPSQKDVFEVSVMRVGKLTRVIHELKPGDIIGARGPLGNGYPIDYFRGKEILVLGGGCGFAPLRSLMYSLFELSGQFKQLYFRGGCKNPGEFLYRREIEGWYERKDLNIQLTVDKGDDTWKGNVGLVLNILDSVHIDYKTAIAIVCGPPVMMKFGTKKLLEMGFSDEHIYLSMEKNMSCGIGKCGHCRIGTYYACKDGPVFTYSKIKSFPEIWD